MSLPTLDFSLILPELVVLITALLVLIADLLWPRAASRGREQAPAVLALAGLILAGLLTLLAGEWSGATLQGMLVADALARYLNLVVLLAAALGLLLSWSYLPHFSTQRSEYYALYLLAVAGMLFLGKSIELITLFVSLEILSIALYVLTGFHRGQLAGGEAALKYFLLGAFSSGFLLYGAALFYAATGATRLADIAAQNAGGFYMLAGLALFLVGLGFKLAVAPFHMWAPDAYQGAPTPVTAFMSVGTKAAALVALFRVVQAAGSVPVGVWATALAFLSLLTMTLGNLAALRQSSLKRMLAYSSIAHAGYLLVGVVAGTAAGFDAVLFYLFAYAFMNIGAFAIASLLERPGFYAVQDAGIHAADGLFGRRPWLAVAMAMFMLSLAGIPPLAGFFGKLYLFAAAVESGWAWLAVAGVLNSVISAYYYLRVVVGMFMAEPSASAHLRLPLPASATLAVALTALGTLLFGLLATPWFQGISR
ncbi:MAG: NADH-quinone oxidoreductase subunit N [Caldilineales bacterium]|nr:NADH-quinone oxidoreductase subunit N [Caldilineales bacterium]